MAELKARLTQRIATTADWAITDVENAGANLVLLKGEIGIEVFTDSTTKMKIGDGISKWSELDYSNKTPDEIASDIEGAKTYADGIVATAKTDAANDATSKASAAQAAAEATAAADATSKASAAEANAKAYAEELVNALDIPTGGKIYQVADLSEISDTPLNGDMAIVTAVISGDKVSRTAYVWDETLNEGTGAWAAFDGNYSAENVFTSKKITLAGDYTSIGNYSKGEEIDAGTSLQSIFSGMLQTTIQPKITANPTATISASGSDNAKEAGESYTLPTATLTVTSGSYTNEGTATGVSYPVGAVVIAYGADPDVEGVISVNNASTLTNGSISIAPATYSPDKTTSYLTDDAVTYTFSGKASHSAGNIAKDNLGEDSNPIIQIGANDNMTVTDKTVTFRGYRKMFIRTTTETSPTINSAFFRASGAKVSEKAAKTTKTFTAAAGDVSFFVAIPTALTTTTPTFNYKFFGEWKALSGVIALDGTVDIAGASVNVDAKPYKVYKYTPESGSFDAATEIQVIIK